MPRRTSLSRRDLIAGAAGTLAVAAPGLRRAAAQVANQAAKPNIVFILADDLGFADVSCYGQQDYTTPNIDRLALEGMRFTQAYANSAVCSATRTALITGRYQYRLHRRPRGADQRRDAQDHRPAAESSDLAVAAARRRLRHDAGRQVASRLPAGFQPAQERLRPLLRHLRRRRRLLQSRARSCAQRRRGLPAL